MLQIRPAGLEAGMETLGELLEAGNRLSGNGAALHLGNGTLLSHPELHRLLDQAETDLRRLGVGRSTRVMTALPDGPLTACVLLALTRSAICAPVNPDLRGGGWEALIPELGGEVLVAHGPCGREARRAASACGLPVIEVELWESHLQWTGASLPGAPAPPVSATPDDLALVLLISGSSARPKRVPLTHRHLTLCARRMTASIDLGPRDCC